MPRIASCPAPNEAIAYHAHIDVLSRDGAAHARAMAWLTATDRQRHERIRTDHDQRMFVLGRVMARALVARALGLAPDGWQWREGARGRPEIAAPDTALKFNLSHSAGLVVCALAHGRDVGVDVEHRRRRPMDPHLIHRYCAPAEAADIESRGADWQERFLLYWTLKEAYLKARGLGVALPLAEICFAPDADPIAVTFLGSLAGSPANWTFALASPTVEHVVAVAVERHDHLPPAVAIAAMPVELLP